jgi:hypothetical protein
LGPKSLFTAPRRFDQLFNASKTYFLAQRLQFHVAPAMKIEAVVLFNRSDSRVPALLA